MVFGIGYSVAPMGEQPDNLEAIRRAAAYQDCHRHLVVTTVLDGLAAEGCAAVAALERSRAISSRQPPIWRAITSAAVMTITKWRFHPTHTLRIPCGKGSGFVKPEADSTSARVVVVPLARQSPGPWLC
jgi:hypothetical protein